MVVVVVVAAVGHLLRSLPMMMCSADRPPVRAGRRRSSREGEPDCSLLLGTTSHRQRQPAYCGAFVSISGVGDESRGAPPREPVPVSSGYENEQRLRNQFSAGGAASPRVGRATAVSHLLCSARAGGRAGPRRAKQAERRERQNVLKTEVMTGLSTFLLRASASDSNQALAQLTATRQATNAAEPVVSMRSSIPPP